MTTISRIVTSVHGTDKRRKREKDGETLFINFLSLDLPTLDLLPSPLSEFIRTHDCSRHVARPGEFIYGIVIYSRVIYLVLFPGYRPSSAFNQSFIGTAVSVRYY